MTIVRIGDGSKAEPAEVIGAKAANLAQMAAIGIPVPPAFVLPIGLCAALANGEPRAQRELNDGLAEGIAYLEEKTGRTFGDARAPLLVSVRSGAARSMPGMLETVLDVGCTHAAVRGLTRMTGNPHFAWDCRRRFLESFGEVVLGTGRASFAQRLTTLTAGEAMAEQALDSEALERLASAYQQLIEDEDLVVPDDPMEQLSAAAQAVYRSWTSERARTYRRLQGLEDLRGTAVTVQAMVFGNRSAASGAGVAFSRDPSTGANQPVIDVAFGCQGEDVVSGNRTPDTEAAIARTMPAIAAQLHATLTRLERVFGDVQDIEFTIENGQLWILQTRAAKRTPQAALRFAIDLVHEHLITPAEGLKRLHGLDLHALASTHLVGAPDPVALGTGAALGIAVGRAAFTSDSATRFSDGGDPVILLRPDTNTADVAGFAAAAGIVTAVGGRTAHAALVARQMGKPCIVGCGALVIDGHGARIGAAALQEGDWLSINGETGAIYLGRCETVTERPEAELREIESWRAATAAA